MFMRPGKRAVATLKKIIAGALLEYLIDGQYAGRFVFAVWCNVSIRPKGQVKISTRES